MCRQSLNQICTEVAHSQKSIEKFLKFTRPAEPMITDINLHQLIDGLIEFLEKELYFSNIKVVRNYAAHLPVIRSNLSDLRHVFQNLIVNAMSAIGKDGEITIKTGQMADRVSVMVSDNGSGIDQESFEKIFDPMFTTETDGMALRLPICWNILEQLGGSIAAQNNSMGGTIFMIELPSQFKMSNT